MTNQRHPHADLIIAWANGAEIERYYAVANKWEDVEYPRWYTHGKYRIKQKTATKTVRIKLALYHYNYVAAVIEHAWEDKEKYYSFRKWLTEPIEISYQEPLSE